MPGKLLTLNHLRLIGKLLQDGGERVTEVKAFEAIPRAAKAVLRDPSDARWVLRTQGHVQAMTDARPRVGAVISGKSVASETAVSPSGTRSLRRTFRGERGQVPLVRDFISRYLDGRYCPAEAVEDVLVCATELAANAVLHSRSGLPGGHFSVEVAYTGQSVHVAVADSGGPWAERGNGGVDAECDGDIDDECGRGLPVVAALSADMGVTGDDAGRMAWFCCRWGTSEQGLPHSGNDWTVRSLTSS
jgi:serine/threonine-protein kinase RsbW